MVSKKLLIALALSTPVLFSCTRRSDNMDVPTPSVDTPQTAPADTSMMAPERNTATTTANTNNMNSTIDTNTERTPATDTDTMNNRTATNNPTRLGAGVTRSHLIEAQKALSSRGYTVSSGEMGGPETTRAIQQFQAEQDLQVTGTVDTPTLRALNIAVGSSGESREPASVPADSSVD